jgi:Ferritin-like
VNRARLAAVLAAPPIPPISTREELIDLLSAAAELEHAIMCQYLFAALSIDRASPELSPAGSELARTFTLELLSIARQEMEHLGIVTNLMIAVGAPPDFDRPNMPIQANYYALDLTLQLVPFGDTFLALAERLEESCSDSRAQRALPYYPTVAAIYDRLSDGLQYLAGPGGPLETTLFLGANDPQISNADFGATPTQVWYSLTLLPVTDLKSALAAVELIRVQGEGATKTDPDSHYAVVRRIKTSWDALAPAERAAMCKPVPPNPVTRERGDVDPLVACSVLRDPRAVKLARIANRAYELILLLLARLYGKSDATAADRDVYRKYAFFPLMTIVIRPLGEILTELPAGDGEHCATTPFELDGPIRTYPDRTSFNLQLGERLTHIAAELAEVAAMPDVPGRLQFVAKNAAYVRDRVLAYVTGTPETHP